ncbi:MAG: protein kinase family protein [Planctomycetes bacterium]|nr:protein kinase family protein [Planctomycetota bacterium]
MAMPDDVRTAFERQGVVFGPLVGEGSFGRVHSALLDGCIRAVKVYKFPLEDAQHGNVVSRELETLRVIKAHPGLCYLAGIIRELHIHVGERGRRQTYVATVWLLGDDDLENRWNDGAIDDAMLLKYFADVAAALDYMHSLGLHHRDIKPKNVLIFDSPPACARLTDFSLAKFVSLTSGNETGHHTPNFAPPETRQRRFHETRDVYSLAASFLFLRTGITAAEGRELYHGGDDLPGLSPAEARIVFEAVAENPVHRPRDGAAAFVARLAAAFAGNRFPAAPKHAVASIA